MLNFLVIFLLSLICFILFIACTNGDKTWHYWTVGILFFIAAGSLVAMPVISGNVSYTISKHGQRIGSMRPKKIMGAGSFYVYKTSDGYLVKDGSVAIEDSGRVVKFPLSSRIHIMDTPGSINMDAFVQYTVQTPIVDFWSKIGGYHNPSIVDDSIDIYLPAGVTVVKHEGMDPLCLLTLEGDK